MVCNVWLRSGNAGIARGVGAFLAEPLAKLPSTGPLPALRAESGFIVADLCWRTSKPAGCPMPLPSG